jgi:electron transfer flavoprotein alpha subunit
MAVLVVADHDNVQLKDNTHKTVTAAKALSDDIDILVAGQNIAGVAAQAAKIAGVRKVLTAESGALGKHIAEALSACIVPLMANYDAVLVAATSVGKNFSPRVAAMLDVAPISEIVAVIDANAFVRPIYAGNALETVRSADAKKVITVRATAFKAAEEGGSAPIEAIDPGPGAPHTRFVSDEIVKSDRPELAGAKIVVSGGRALGSAEEFHRVIEPLADKLGAAVAIGISGAIQHLAGMKDSKVIVAINKDADAPIFQVADYGLVADYKTAVPELMAALTAAGK